MPAFNFKGAKIGMMHWRYVSHKFLSALYSDAVVQVGPSRPGWKVKKPEPLGRSEAIAAGPPDGLILPSLARVGERAPCELRRADLTETGDGACWKPAD